MRHSTDDPRPAEAEAACEALRRCCCGRGSAELLPPPLPLPRRFALLPSFVIARRSSIQGGGRISLHHARYGLSEKQPRAF